MVVKKGIVEALFICPAAGETMQSVKSVEAITGAGLKGDRYCTGEGSWSKGKLGNRQVTLINAIFFLGSGFNYVDSRRNIVVRGIELMRLIGEHFSIGETRMRGVQYCYPCDRPSGLAGKSESFERKFHDRGGLVAEVIEGGIIRVADDIIRLS